MRFPVELEQRSLAFWAVTGTVLVGVLGVADYFTGYEISFSLFYLIPVFLVGWYSTRHLALSISALSAIVWLGADVASGARYTNAVIPVWNMLIRLGFFVTVALLLGALRAAHEREQRFARIDHLTGVLNARHFLELADAELARSRRYARTFTVAYLDVDNFKEMNDRFGHAAGDQVLQAVGQHLRDALRRTDLVGRMGGDEFVLLLPETSDEAARAVMTKVHDALSAQMRQWSWPVTFSVGVVTFATPPDSVADIIKSADNLMYAVKRSGKGNVNFLTRRG